MRSRWFLVVYLLLPYALFADPPCDPTSVLEAHLKTTQAPPEVTLVLGRNHLGGWIGGRWNGTNIVADDGFANLHLAEPTVTMGKNDQLQVFLVNTNPLAYSAVQTGGELVDRTDIADLQQIIGLLANVGTSALRIQAQRTASAEVWTRNLDKRTRAQARIDASIANRTTPRPIDELDAIAGAVIDQVEVASQGIDSHVRNIKDSATTVEGHLDRADTLNTDAKLFITRVEAGDATEPRIVVDARDDNLPSVTATAFNDLASKTQALEKIPLSCPAAVAAAAAAVDRKILGLGEDADAQLAALRDYRSKLTEMAGETDRCSPAMARVLEPLRRWLAKNEPGANAATDPQLATLIDLHIAVQSYAAIDTARSEALTQARTAIGKRGTAVRTATAFLDLRNRYRTAFAGGDPCSLTNGVVEVRRTLLTNVNQPFTKDGKETFTVSLDDRFEEEALRHDKELTAAYQVVARRKFDIDFDFAAVYTSLSDPTFGTETHVIEEAHDDQPAKTELRIARKDETTRAGEVALMASFRGELFGFDTNPFALQVGAGLSTEKPALYTGIAYQIGRYVKLSTGWTFQKVTRLAEGLHEDDVVPNEDAVRTRDAFADQWYAAISITLDDIAFFRPKE